MYIIQYTPTLAFIFAKTLFRISFSVFSRFFNFALMYYIIIIMSTSVYDIWLLYICWLFFRNFLFAHLIPIILFRIFLFFILLLLFVLYLLCTFFMIASFHQSVFTLVGIWFLWTLAMICLLELGTGSRAEHTSVNLKYLTNIITNESK